MAKHSSTENVKEGITNALIYDEDARKLSSAERNDLVDQAFREAVPDLSRQLGASSDINIGEATRALDTFMQENPDLLKTLAQAAGQDSANLGDTIKGVITSALIVGEASAATEKGQMPAMTRDVALQGTLLELGGEPLIDATVRGVRTAETSGKEKINQKERGQNQSFREGDIIWQDVKTSIKDMTNGAIKNKDMDKVIGNYRLDERGPTVEGIKYLINYTDANKEGKLTQKAGMDVDNATRNVIGKVEEKAAANIEAKEAVAAIMSGEGFSSKGFEGKTAVGKHSEAALNKSGQGHGQGIS